MTPSQLLIIFILFIVIPLALLPTIIAVKKNHPHKIPIILINIFGGFIFGIGWIVALIWCFITPNRIESTASYDLEKLYALKEKGIITELEFNEKKKKYLSQ